MAIVETYIQTYEKDGVNCIAEFTDDAFIVKTHEEGQKIMDKIAERFYPILKAQYLRELEEQQKK